MIAELRSSRARRTSKYFGGLEDTPGEGGRKVRAEAAGQDLLFLLSWGLRGMFWGQGLGTKKGGWSSAARGLHFTRF